MLKKLKSKSSTSSVRTNRTKIDQTKYWSEEREYELSREHPHRQLILDELKKLEPFAGVLEVGCNIGQNLTRIQEVYPETQLAGVDVNTRALGFAKLDLPKAILFPLTAELLNSGLGFESKSFDILIYDAVLMYVKDIDKALDEAVRVGRKAIIIIDWEAKKEKLIGYSLARDYEKLLTDKGLTVNKIKITKDIWDNPKWIKYGQCYVCHLV